MKRVLYTLTAMLMIGSLSAQINHGGTPYTWQHQGPSEEVPFLKMSKIDKALALAQDAVTDEYKETPYRFGIEHEVDINFFEEAESFTIKGDRQVWRMGIECPQAVSINFLFDEFYMPDGAELYVYSEDREHLKGAYTSASNKSSGQFPVGIAKGERIILEYIENFAGEQALMHISQIVHGYRAVVNKWEQAKGPYGTSGPCNINANCPEGDAWQAQKRSVALIIDGGDAQCSGAMINNVLQDETPFFLTANHCLGNPSSWVYVFNHETASCTGNTGPTDQTISGGDLLASNGGSDFALIELSANVPESYNVYFSGWDNSDATTVTSAVGIHHPSGDLKKICFENDAPYHANAAGAAVWFIDEWELGVTEGGSSGSPLYDQNGRIIGQLFGGQAACNGTVNNGEFDYYGRLGVSWDGSSSSSRLRDHLDPSNSGATVLDGFGPNDVQFAVDAAGQGVAGIPDLLCALDPFTPTYTLRNAGTSTLTSATINYAYNGAAQPSISWTGSLAQGETEVVSLNTFTPVSGNNTVEVTVSAPNGVADENTANNTSVGSVASVPNGNGDLVFTILTDDYAGETTWAVLSESGATIATGGENYENATTYEEVIPLPGDGCYTFEIYDTQSDGICCDYGIGDYSLSDSNGNELAVGGEFGSVDTRVFSMSGTTSLEESQIARFGLYPNPSEGMLNISLEEAIGTYDIRIMSITGQTVYRANALLDNNLQLDLSAIAGGTYLLEIRSETQSGVKRFTIK